MKLIKLSSQLKLLILLLFALTPLLRGQLFNASQLWGDARYFFFLTDSLEIVGEAGYRVDNLENYWQKIYINPHVRWVIDHNWELRGGAGVYYSKEKALSDALEIRPWQGGLLYWPKTRWFMIQHYLRVEERFHFTQGSNIPTFDLRLRYRIGTKIPLNILTNPINRLYMPLQFELFSAQEDNLIERYPSRTRLIIGLGFRNGLVWGIDVNYIYQQSTQGGTVTSSDHILRLRVRFYGFKMSQSEATE